ncbi:YARHG domain-containing protein [Fulvivirga sp. 29W222]|uniref:YARHG domain-containing protein n=1 Tax=Fulvivirga marina TaxID=2494733 RepID=A0A937G1I2_9BACT|nr:YARHG domain-containing protein [Fulvivirga marina]MBL6448461.1 YARHG domain-containing protein [Fulvivirga marina]
MLLLLGSLVGSAQSIEEYFGVEDNSKNSLFVRLNDIKVIESIDEKFNYQNKLTLFNRNQKIDSLSYDNENVLKLPYTISEESGKIFLCYSNELKGYQKLSIGGKTLELHDLYLDDSLIFIERQYNHAYYSNKVLNSYGSEDPVEVGGQVLYRQNIISRTFELLYDFYKIPEIKDYETWAPVVPYITDVFQVGDSNDKILIETGIFDGGLMSLNYFILNVSSGQVENITRTENFQKITVDPKENLVNHIDFKRLYFEPQIGSYFLMDASDTLAYFTADFSEGTARWEQDAFVINKDYQIVDRALKRDLYEVGFVIEDKKSWYRIRSASDSTLLDFNIQLRYPMEKAFYNIYYDLLLNKESLANVDIHELSILKNFIFAKHNYQFQSSFYQAYFNTFSFYNSKESKKHRRKDVNNLLTEMDKKNLDVILKKIRDL